VSEPPLLACRDIRHSYGGDWSLEVGRLALEPGAALGLIGPNGSGKSTLLRIAAGTLAPRSGRVDLEGEPLSRLARPRIARTLAYLPQDAHTESSLTVAEVARLGRYAHTGSLGTLNRRDCAAIDRALDWTSMRAKAARALHTLSGGERRRALLASVLAQEPRALLLDEPTAALDLHHSAQFFRILRDLAREGMALGIVTHDLNLASLFCDRLLLLHEGRVLEEGAPGAVLRGEGLRTAYGADLLLCDHPQSGQASVLPRTAPPDAGDLR
jgi:iron complex transport system ATP-binding protein